MDMQLGLGNRAGRWGAVLCGSLALWVLPIGLRAPKLLIFISLPSAIAGFGWCATQAHGWRYASAFARKSSALAEELENYEFGLKEQYLKAEVEAQYYPPAPQQEYQETAWGPFTLHRAVPPVTLGPAPAPQATPENYTIHNLSFDEARDLIAQTLAAGMTKEDIIFQLWGAKKGGSKKYKNAEQQYQQLTKTEPPTPSA